MTTCAANQELQKLVRPITLGQEYLLVLIPPRLLLKQPITLFWLKQKHGFKEFILKQYLKKYIYLNYKNYIFSLFQTFSLILFCIFTQYKVNFKCI